MPSEISTPVSIQSIPWPRSIDTKFFWYFNITNAHWQVYEWTQMVLNGNTDLADQPHFKRPNDRASAIENGQHTFTDLYLILHWAISSNFFTMLSQSLKYHSPAFLWHSIYYDSSYSNFLITFETPFVWILQFITPRFLAVTFHNRITNYSFKQKKEVITPFDNEHCQM